MTTQAAIAQSLKWTSLGDVVNQLGHDWRTVWEWRNQGVTTLAAMDGGEINVVRLGRIEVDTAARTYTIHPREGKAHIQSAITPTAARSQFSRSALEAMGEGHIIANYAGTWRKITTGAPIEIED